MKNQIKKLVAVTSILALGTISLAGCSRGADTTADANAKKLVLLVSTLNNPFFVDMRDGAEAEAKAKGYALEISDAQNDSATQQNQSANAISVSASAVIINPVDSDDAGPAVTQLNNSKIPVVAVDRTVNGGKLSAFVSSDNILGGKLAAENLAKAIGDQGEVIHLQGIPGTSASRDRGKGFTEGIGAFQNVKIVATQTANFDRAEALNVVSNLLQAYPNVKAIFAENDEMALGAIKALGDKAGKSVKVFGFDGTSDAMQAIQNGTLLGSIAQQPKELGKVAVDSAIDLIEGKKVPEMLPVEVKPVTSANIAEFTK